MADLNFSFDNRGRIPADIKKTLGKLEVLKVLEPRQVFEDGEPTGEVLDRPVEFLSSAVGGSVVVTFAAGVDTSSLQTFDEIILNDEDVEVVPWANIDPNAFGNFADSDVKITAATFNRAGANVPPRQSQMGQPKQQTSVPDKKD